MGSQRQMCHPAALSASGVFGVCSSPQRHITSAGSPGSPGTWGLCAGTPCQRASWRGAQQRGQRAQLRSNNPKGLGKSTLRRDSRIRAAPRQVVASGTAVMFSASGRGAAQGLTGSRRQRGRHCPGDSKVRRPTSPGRRGAGRGGHCSLILSTVTVVILAESVFLLSDTWTINQALHWTLMSRQASDTKRNVVYEKVQPIHHSFPSPTGPSPCCQLPMQCLKPGLP